MQYNPALYSYYGKEQHVEYPRHVKDMYVHFGLGRHTDKVAKISTYVLNSTVERDVIIVYFQCFTQNKSRNTLFLADMASCIFVLLYQMTQLLVDFGSS